MKPHPHYGYFPGGQPAWQTSFRTAIEPVETRVCSCCGENKPASTFKQRTGGRCGACRYAATDQAKVRAKKLQAGQALTSQGYAVQLAPRKYVGNSKRHIGAHSRAKAK